MNRPPTTRSVLIVTEEPTVARELASRLGPMGVTVEFASTGQSALRTLAEDGTDLVLLELDLPDMSGLEVLRKIRMRRNALELPVIVQAPPDARGPMFEAFQIGASDFVTKPLDLDVCAARVSAHMRVRETARGIAPGGGGGAVLAERYELGDVIGTGTFGVVYRARHLILEDEVAVKLIHPEHARRAEGRARFQREAQAAWALRHPNAVAVLDFGIEGESTAYLVMELLEGVSLDEVASAGDRLPLARCLDIVLPVCDALEAAHGLGIVHRDVKPSNIFLANRRGREQVKLLDFGIAELTAGSARLTLDGWVGTPTYMAPERFLSEPCDGRADVYSLGVVLYQLLAGRAPFVLEDYDPIALALLHLREAPPPLPSLRPDVPAQLVGAIESAMAKRAADRPDAAAFRAALLDARAALSEDPAAG